MLLKRVWVLAAVLGTAFVSLHAQSAGMIGRAFHSSSSQQGNGNGLSGSLLAQTDLTRVGYWAWTQQQGATGQDAGSDYSGLGLCLDPNDGTMFFVNESQPEVSHINIPTPIDTTTVASMNVPTFVQTEPVTGNGWSRGFSGNISSDNFAAPIAQFTTTSATFMANCLVLGDGRLLMSMFTNYTGDTAQRMTHFTHSRSNLFDGGASFAGYYSVVQPNNNIWTARYVANYMASVPSGMQSSFGGDTVLGLGQNFYTSIVSSLSQGPSAFIGTATTMFPPSATVAGGGATYAPTPLLYYPYGGGQSQWLGAWDNGATPNAVWNGNSEIGGVAIIPDHHTALFIGSTSIGAFCYGNGVTTGTPPNPTPIAGSGPNPPNDGLLDGTNPAPSGTNASTDATGTIVTLPNANLSGVGSALTVWLKTQTTPTYARTGAAGLVDVVSTANSGTPTAQVTVAQAFTPNLTNQQYQIGEVNCYDSERGAAKGQHGFPYHWYAWAYDLNDFLAVKQGTKQPYQVTPYGTWDLESLFQTLAAPAIVNHRAGGLAYDPVTRRIYFVMRRIFGNNDPVTIVLHVA